MICHRLRLPLLPGMLLALVAGAAQAQEPVSRTLANGMEVLVLVDNRAPVAVSQIWYGVGSAAESPGQTGVSHFLEHLMFRGTEKYPGKALDRVISENGGRSNAYTSRDYTAYYEILSRDRLEVSLEVEADRMRGLVLTEDGVVKEREVVLEERRLRTDDQPESFAYEQLYATAFQNHPYGQPVIGWSSDIAHTDLATVRAWYDRFYTPSNARLVVVGDVRPEEIFSLAKKHFEAIPEHAAVPPPVREEPPQAGPRRVDLRLPAQTEYVILGYKSPNLAQLPQQRRYEAYAMSMLSTILSGGGASRLVSGLVRGDQVATRAGAHYSLYKAQPGLLILDGIPAQGRNAQELEQALVAEITRLQEELVTDEELERARAQVVAGMVYAKDSLSHRAHMIGMLETIGLGWETEDDLLPRYRAVTAEQVREVAQLYLTENARTTVIVHPIRNPPLPTRS